MTRFQIAATASALALALALSLGAVALAHEPRDVGGLSFVVGWTNEPTIVGERNGLSLTIARPITATTAVTTTAHTDEAAGATDHAAEHAGAAEDDDALHGQPVEGAEKTLTAEVLFGGETKQLALRPVPGQPGDYTADLLPTRAGDYRFHFTGSVDGQAIDETFDSADGKFDGAADTTDIQFPASAPAAAESQPGESQAGEALKLAALQQTADSIRLLAFLGIGIGLAALLLALAALSRGRS